MTLCVQSRLCLFGAIVDNEMILNSAGLMIDHWWNKLAYKFQNVQLNEYVVMPNHFHGIIQIQNPAEPDQRNQGEYNKEGERDQDKEGAHTGAPLHVGVDPRVYPDPPYAPLPQHRVVPDRRDESEKPERTHQINTGRTHEIERGRTHGCAPTVGVDPRVYPDSPYAPLREISLTPVGGVNPQILGGHMGSPLRWGRPACLPCYSGSCLPSPPDASLHKMIQWFKTMTTNEYIRNERQNGWTPFDKKLWQRNYYEHIIRDNESSQEIREYIINNPINWKDDTLFPEIIDTLLDTSPPNGAYP